MKSENQEIVGEKCIKNKDGNMHDDKSKLGVWKQHYEGLLNSEFEWDKSVLSHAGPILGPPLEITQGMVLSAIKKMKFSKSVGPSRIIPE